jgi:formimidoylglutamate deiminase
LRQLEYPQRPAQRARNMFAGDPGHSTGRSLFDAALAGGAQALGIGAGGLRPGAPADMVALDVNHPALASRDGDQWLDAWIFAAARPAVEAVWVRGRRVVADGRHVARTRIDRAFRLALQRLLAA